MNEHDKLIDIMKYVTKDLEAYNSSWGKVYEEYEEEIDDFEERRPRNEAKFNYEQMLLNVLKYLDQAGGVEFAVLKDPELGRYWNKKKKEIEHQKKVDAAKEKLMSALSEEERKLLGIKLK